jgi:hypothetical protein
VPDLRLSPFPDDVTLSGDKWRAIAFLRGLALPSNIAAAHLSRFARYHELQLTQADYAQVKGALHNRS